MIFDGAVGFRFKVQNKKRGFIKTALFPFSVCSNAEASKSLCEFFQVIAKFADGFYFVHHVVFERYAGFRFEREH